MKIKLNNLLKYVGFALAILALVCLALPGVSASESGISVKIALAGFMFGSPKVVTTAGGHSITLQMTGGISIFALISLLLLVAGLVVMVVSFLKKNKKLVLLAAFLVVLAGVLMFLLKVAGTPFGGKQVDGTIAFKEFLDEMNTGVGTILYGIFAILSGASFAASKYVK